jgi:hypothetical protein
MNTTASLKTDPTRYLVTLQRVLAGVCLLFLVAGWWDDSLGHGWGFQNVPFLFVTFVYVGLVVFSTRYKEVALGTSIGLMTGFLWTLYLTKLGIIFVLVRPSPSRTLFYHANLLLVGTGILTWAACYRSLDHIKLLIALFVSFTTVVLLLQALRLF